MCDAKGKRKEGWSLRKRGKGNKGCVFSQWSRSKKQKTRKRESCSPSLPFAFGSEKNLKIKKGKREGQICALCKEMTEEDRRWDQRSDDDVSRHAHFSIGLSLLSPLSRQLCVHNCSEKREKTHKTGPRLEFVVSTGHLKACRPWTLTRP